MGNSENFRDTATEWYEKLRYELSGRVGIENLVVYDGVVLDATADVISHEIRQAMIDGWYEKQEATLVRYYLSGDRDVIELGAGIGYLSAVIDEQLDAGRTHVAVEPNPAVVPFLEKTRRLNDGNWIIHEAAYHSTADAVGLILSGDYWSATTGNLESESTITRGSVSGRTTESTECDVDTSEAPSSAVTGKSQSQSTVVSATSLASLCSRYDISTFALVLDIEGAEYDLLTEELDLLTARCPLVIVEFHEQGPAADEYDNDILDAGFELVRSWDDVFVYRNTTFDR